MTKHLLKLLDLSSNDILEILNLADQMKYNLNHGLKHSYLKGKTLAMIFTKASTRTRVSFETGMYQLGGHAIILNAEGSQIGRGEPVQDTARVLSRYCNGLMIRTFAQAEVEEFAKFSTVPVINGLTDFSHPCQVLADLMTMRERLSKLKGAKVCWVGDGNNMANSMIVGALKSGMKISCACPSGYEPDEKVLKFAASYGDKFLLTSDIAVAAKDADVMVTDVWSSMGQESEMNRRSEAFKGYQLNAETMSYAKRGAIVQHCLPAHRGEEITTEVFDAHASEIFDEAENRLHAQKAVLTLLLTDSLDLEE